MTWSLLLAAAGWIAGWFLWGRPLRLDQVAEPVLHPRRTADLRSVTVVIPARNEAAVLGGLLTDLADQARPADRVVVVDDHSEDETAAIAAAAGDHVDVVAAPPLPPGWAGKNWACHTGVRAGAELVAAEDDDLLVFLDADVRLAPGALDVVRGVIGPGRVVSVQPHHVTRRRYEQLSLFCGLVALGALGAGRRTGAPSGLCGPLIATTVGDYRRAGGHESVRAQVIEDVALGERYLDSGTRTAVVLGGELVRFRMYGGGPGQLVEGWSKNLASGAGAVPLLRTVLTTLWVTALGGAAADAVTALWAGSGQRVALAWAVYAAFVAQVGTLGGRTGTFPWSTAALYPVPLAAFVALFLRSIWLTHVRRRVVWRGRSLPTGRLGTRT